MKMTEDKDSFEKTLQRRKEHTFLANRRYVLKRNYNITLEEYNSLLVKQFNSCGVCGNGQSGTKHKNNTFCVDHDHKTGLVRGLLCHSCNTIVIPAVEYYLNRLDSAKKYLQVSKKDDEVPE